MVKRSDGSSVVRLSSFCLEGTLLEEADRDDFLHIPAVDGLSARGTIAFAAVVVLLSCHESTCQAFVAENVAYMYGQCSSRFVSCLHSTYHR